MAYITAARWHSISHGSLEGLWPQREPGEAKTEPSTSQALLDTATHGQDTLPCARLPFWDEEEKWPGQYFLGCHGNGAHEAFEPTNSHPGSSEKA